MKRKREGYRVKKRDSAQESNQNQNRRRVVYRRKDGREVRRIAVYLPVPLARSLMVRCAEDDSDLSHTVAEAVARYLESGN